VPATPDPPPGEPGGALVELVRVMAQLRAECAWKREQTHRSLSRYLLEEAHETLEAIDTGEATGSWDHLREELGDLLLQVYFHAVVADEAGEFTIDDVAAGITAKLRRRNPHVFGDAEAADPASVNEMWEAIKAEEKQRPSPLDGLPPTLPALLLADKALDRLDRVRRTRGDLPPSPQGSPAGPAEPAADPTVEVGERLLALVAEARLAGVDPEQALRDAVRRLAP